MTESRALKWVAWGCGAVALIVATITVAVALNWQRVANVYQQAKTSISNLMHVSVTLQDKYGGHVNATSKHQSGVEGAILQITLTNPQFLAQGDLGEQAVKKQAIEAAIAARDALDAQSRYEHYEIVFLHQSGSGITTSQSWSFSFSADDLRTDK